MALITFGDWLPDLPPRDNPGALRARNVIPRRIGYGPFKNFASNTAALTARCQGAFTMRDLSGNVANFAGDATKLYKLETSGLTWEDVSRTVGGAYATDTANAWSFCQFRNIVIAVNGTDAPQAYTMGSSTDFALLDASAPIARFCATVDPGFVFMGRLASAFQTIQWSPINDPEGTWGSDPATQADLQVLPDGGAVMGLVGGVACTVLQRNAIRRAIYIGDETVFNIIKISASIGCDAENSIAAQGDNAFFHSDNGFYQLVGGAQLVPIGENKINRTFLEDLDPAYPYRVVGAIDPERSLYVVIYPGSGSSGGTPNRGLVYHWPSERWADFEVNLEWVYQAQSQSGYTLDTLDSVSASIDALPASLDSPLWAASGKLILGAFDTTHKQGFFTGANLQGEIDTGEIALDGKRGTLLGGRPVVDCPTATLTPIVRGTQFADPTVGTASAVNAFGFCPLLANSRFFRGRTIMPAGTNWTHAQGLDDLKFNRTTQW